MRAKSEAAAELAAMAAGTGASGSDDTCSTYEWRPTVKGERGGMGDRGDMGGMAEEPGTEGEEEQDRESSHSSDLDFIADELERA